MVKIDVKKRFIPKEALQLILNYLLLTKVSREHLDILIKDFNEKYEWAEKYILEGELLIWLKRKKPNMYLQALIPIMLSKSYKTLGCDSPSAEVFADIAYEILKLPRPEKKLNKTPLVKEIVDFIQAHPVEILEYPSFPSSQ